jgi:hypothetical protein
MSNQARCAAAAANAASSGHQVQQQQLQLYVFEAEPEALARHMLLLMALFDATLTARERAEMFLELHGNVLLRQRTADWACEWRLSIHLMLFASHSAQPKRHTSTCPGWHGRCKPVPLLACPRWPCARWQPLLTHACCLARCR